MSKIPSEQEAYALLECNSPQPVGYRVKVKPLSVEVKAKDSSVIVMTSKQEDKENRGMNIGIVHAVGPSAYQDKKLGEPWIKAGDIVWFPRYAGVQIEHPKGSKEVYQFMNDDDIYGRIEP